MYCTDLEETQWQVIKKILNLQERKRKYRATAPKQFSPERKRMGKCSFFDKCHFCQHKTPFYIIEMVV